MTASKIMVVDGSGVSRELVARFLVNSIPEAHVTSCASGGDALEQLSQNRYNLITTSLGLPDMDGLDLCHAIRRTVGSHHAPIIVISADANQRLLKEGFAAGVTGYFDKSQGYPAFGAFIKTFCQRNRGLAGRVLYVEDSNTAAVITRRLMERHGLQVTHVTSAEQALERLERMRLREESYDLVITDFYLQEAMTGGDLLHAIRVHFRFSLQELPVLIITGQDDKQIQAEVFHAGANDFVHKPLVEEVLMARIRSMLLIHQLNDALERQTSQPDAVAVP